MNRDLVAQLAFSQEMAAVNNNFDFLFVSRHLSRNGAAVAAELAKQEAQILTNCTGSK